MFDNLCLERRVSPDVVPVFSRLLVLPRGERNKRAASAFNESASLDAKERFPLLTGGNIDVKLLVVPYNHNVHFYTFLSLSTIITAASKKATTAASNSAILAGSR